MRSSPAINGVPVQPDAIDTAMKELRGPIGSKISLTIVHADGGKPVVIPLVRERIRVASVSTRMLEPGFAYIRISEFQEDTADELTRKLEAFKPMQVEFRRVDSAPDVPTD